MITKKTALRRLNKQLNTMFTKEQQKDLAFMPDQEDEKGKTISWFFKTEDRKIELMCCLRQGIVITSSAPF